MSRTLFIQYNRSISVLIGLLIPILRRPIKPNDIYRNYHTLIYIIISFIFEIQCFGIFKRQLFIMLQAIPSELRFFPREPANKLSNHIIKYENTLIIAFVANRLFL